MTKKPFLKKLFTYIKNPLKVKYLLFLMENGYLYEKGWLNSLTKKEIVDKNNDPIPWFSYPAIEFLDQVLPSSTNIFEFGAGNSTLYFSSKYASVTSVENDADWFKKISKKLYNNANTKLILATERDEYINSLAQTKNCYSLIVIDGRWRKPCLIEAAKFLNKGGFIVLDDADRDYYKPAIDKLKNEGYNAISFNGMSAGSFDNHSTMIFWQGKQEWQ